MNDINTSTPLERPLECSECKKKATVRYTEVIEGISNRVVMCADCPFLIKKLSGNTDSETVAHSTDADLCCGHCATTLDVVRTGSLLGCSECYDIFATPLTQEFIKAEKLPEKICDQALRDSINLHQGYSPGEAKEISPSMRLLALNEALNETLSKEDYEQAAWLRDQIRALKNKENS